MRGLLLLLYGAYLTVYPCLMYVSLSALVIPSDEAILTSLLLSASQFFAGHFLLLSLTIPISSTLLHFLQYTLPQCIRVMHVQLKDSLSEFVGFVSQTGDYQVFCSSKYAETYATADELIGKIKRYGVVPHLQVNR